MGCSSKIIKEENGEIGDNSEEESALNPSNESSGSIIKVPAKDRLHKKALYDSLSFEVELQKIFTEDDPDEVWLISPWIRKGAFLHDRGPMIEDFLRDENKRVFIAYSEPATNNDGKPMMDEEVEPGIKLLDEQYSNFFYVQLPEFHLKNVIEVKGDQKVLFSGSFNVLSFSVSDQQTHVRREEMALAHHSVARKKYEDCQLEFAEIYANRIRKEIEQLDLNMLANYKNERLEYFLKIDNEEIRKLFSPLEDMLEEKAYERIKSEVNKKLVKIGQELVAASNMSGLNPKDKKRLTSMLTNIESEMQYNSIDDPSMQDLLNNNKDLLEKIREKKIFPGRKESNTTKPVNKTPRVNATTEDKSNGILNTEPDATIEGLTLYIASLSLAFINREIKKNALNAKLLAIIEDEEMVNLLEMVGVANSKNVDNAFDLSLGINGYLFRFSKLFNDRESFNSKQKRAKRFLTQVNPSNIQAIVNKLS